MLLARSVPIWEVDICEDRSKTGDSCEYIAASGQEEGHVGDVAPYRAEQSLGAERGEDSPVRRVVE